MAAKLATILPPTEAETEPVPTDIYKFTMAYPLAGAVYSVVVPEAEVFAATAVFTLIVVFELTRVALIDSP